MSEPSSPIAVFSTSSLEPTTTEPLERSYWTFRPYTTHSLTQRVKILTKSLQQSLVDRGRFRFSSFECSPSFLYLHTYELFHDHALYVLPPREVDSFSVTFCSDDTSIEGRLHYKKNDRTNEPLDGFNTPPAPLQLYLSFMRPISVREHDTLKRQLPKGGKLRRWLY